MIILPTMRGIIFKRIVTESLVGSYVGSSGTLTTTVSKPAGLAADDYMFVFVGHGDATISGGSGSWSKSTIVWPTYSYTTTILHKQITATDVSSTLTVSGVSSSGVVSAAWRGPVSAYIMSSTNESSGSTIAMARTAKNALSLGQVGFTSDRDPSGTPSAPSGWTTRLNFTGTYFQLTVGDLIDGTQPLASGTDTWTGYTATYPQVGFNIELRADDITYFPAMTANYSGGFTASASNESYGSAYLAFDNNPSTFWGSNPDVSWLKIKLPAARKATTYYVRNRTGNTNQAPTQWQFEGSNDDSNWTVLDSQTGITWADGEEKTYNISSPASFRYYRLNILDNSNNGTIAAVAGLRFTFA